jgi:hypothetical protein
VPKAKAAAFLNILLLVSCSRPKTLSKDELRSQLRSAVSVAAETETFIDYFRQNRATRSYAQGHITYLADEVNRSIRQADKALPSEGTEEQFRAYLTQLSALSSELAAVRSASGEAEALGRAKERIVTIRQALENTKSSL